MKFFLGGSVREMLARGFSRLRTRDRCHVQRRICKRGSCESSRVTGAVGSECDSLPRLIIHIGGCATWRGVQPRALLVPVRSGARGQHFAIIGLGTVRSPRGSQLLPQALHGQTRLESDTKVAMSARG